jgi:hypothetical protein
MAAGDADAATLIEPLTNTVADAEAEHPLSVVVTV